MNPLSFSIGAIAHLTRLGEPPVSLARSPDDAAAIGVNLALEL